MNWLQSLLYGFVSGLSEIVPVSASAHQAVLLKLFGFQYADPLLDFLVHVAVMFGIYTGCSNLFSQLKRKSRPNRHRAPAANYDIRFIKNAAIPLAAGLIIFTYGTGNAFTLAGVSVFCLINGLVLFITGRAMHGNKDARKMSSLDAVATGLLSALSVLPGISRVGIGLSYPILRGADRQSALNWVFLINFTALAVLSLLDIFSLFTAFEVMSFAVYLGYLLAAGSAYLGTICAIAVMRFLAVRTGYSGFSYCCWGTALFAFILYLI